MSTNFCFPAVALAVMGMVALPTSGVVVADQNGRVSEVTLYRNQALVTRTIDVDAGAGTGELVVTDLPENVLPDSLFAEGSDGVEVRAVQFRTRAVGQSPREEVRDLQDKLVVLQDQLNLNRKNVEIANRKVTYLDQLEKTVAPEDASESNLEATDLERMTLFLFEQRELIAPRQIELAKETRDLNDQIGLLNRQLAELTNGSTKTVREAVLYIGKNDESTQQIRLNYLVSNCGWSPTYSIRAEGELTTAKLDYNGLIYQMSGEDWTDIALTLSTASPALSASGPGLAPLRMTLVPVNDPSQNQFAQTNKVELGAIVSRQQKALLDNRNAINFQELTDSNWTINAAADELACVEIVGDSTTVQNMRSELNLKSEEPSLAYQLSSGVTVTSRNSRQMVRIVSTDLPSSFYHVATPVLASYVYREAEVTNNSSEDFLGGPITVYLDSKFVGRGEIQSVARGQKFVVGFGADPQLRTRREMVDRADDINGGNRELTFEYRLVVENFKDSDAKIRLLDRMPTSLANGNMRITSNDFSAKLSDDELYLRLERPNGILRWDVDIPANSAAKDAYAVDYTFTVEYDRKYVVALPGTIDQQREEFEQLQRGRMRR